MDHFHYHKDGSIWAKGKKINDVLDGYWEWFRKDGTKSRSGYFYKGKQVGEWTTYDKLGKVYRVTQMKNNMNRLCKAEQTVVVPFPFRLVSFHASVLLGVKMIFHISINPGHIF